MDEKKKAGNGEITAKLIVKAVDAKTGKSNDELSKHEADNILNDTANEAKDAEKFDHGKEDAGAKE